MNTEFKHNYYEILNISENASQQEILYAYEQAKRTYSLENKSLHTIFTSDEASELRRMVEEAYEVLSNQVYRNIYEKRKLANTFSEEELSVEAIKAAGDSIFQRVIPPIVEAASDKKIISTIEENQQSVILAPELETSSLDEEYENELLAKREWSGAELKKAREYRQLTYDELTDITKINPWYIAAIENMDPANLPVQVFVRGYVLQIAKALGLKEKTVAESYMRLFRAKIEN